MGEGQLGVLLVPTLLMTAVMWKLGFRIPRVLVRTITMVAILAAFIVAWPDFATGVLGVGLLVALPVSLGHGWVSFMRRRAKLRQLLPPKPTAPKRRVERE